MQQRTATLTVNGHQFIVVVSAQWGAGLTNPSESPTQEMLLVTGEKRAGEGESSASAQTLPFSSVLPGHIVQGARPGQDKREPQAGRFRFYLKVFGVCATPKPSLVLGRGWPRTGELGRRGVGVSVTDGLWVVGAFVDGGDCLNRDVLPTSLCVSAA